VITTDHIIHDYNFIIESLLPPMNFEPKFGIENYVFCDKWLSHIEILVYEIKFEPSIHV